MGQAKARGPREQRIALAEQKAADAREAARLARAAQRAREEAAQTERMHRVNSQRQAEGMEPLPARHFRGGRNGLGKLSLQRHKVTHTLSLVNGIFFFKLI